MARSHGAWKATHIARWLEQLGMLQGGATTISGDPNQTFCMLHSRSACLIQLLCLCKARLAPEPLPEFEKQDGYLPNQFIHGTGTRKDTERPTERRHGERNEGQ